MSSPTFGLFFGTQSGGSTFDQDEFGGNPFATSLIELAAQASLSLHKLPASLRTLTSQRTQGQQVPECKTRPSGAAWRFPLDAGSRAERRVALVLAVSAYEHPRVDPLTGAAVDERRIAAMLASHGFSVTQGVAHSRSAITAALRAFAARSRQSDVSIIYATGHGIEMDGEVYLLPGDYPFDQGYGARSLKARAIPIHRISSASQGTQLNLVFFAGCRTLAPQPIEG